MRTWKVLKWEHPNTGDKKPDGVPLQCECGHDAWCPTSGQAGALLIAAKYMWLVFDPAGHKPPVGWMPDQIQCRKCGRVYGSQRDQEKTDIKNEVPAHVR